MANLDTSSLKALLDPAKTVTILFPGNPNYDHVAAGLGLKLVLEAGAKSVTVVCPDPMTVQFNRLVGVESVTDSLGSRQLLITFPGQTEYVDKVGYDLVGGELQLVITPKQDSPDLDHHKLQFIKGHGRTDIAILVGVNQLSDLGSLNEAAVQFLSDAKIIALSHQPPAQDYAHHVIYHPDASSVSELVVHLLDSLGIDPDADTATNLLSGIEDATDYFRSPRVNVNTFEIAAYLLRRGARRHQPVDANQLPPGAVPQAVPPIRKPLLSQKTPPPAAVTPVPSTALGFGTDSQQPEEPVEGQAKPAPSPDWYEPKIFQGSMLP
ncbi:MAG: hypothetical protein UY28_C0001G0042 [Candidatus Amesbacteria bacterium GW2011_GWB1_48_13]|uniref:Uncharacterized protein n=1 Tax=Candidatus Amesbacteria bacterium GW2011_GWB1_48_13 TaxID=1618362 RepID=A0A0G1UWG1_9BACT|nr:MAG: hypothetical protein UY28_C0001G0042 [Candidatus Amesbacteria bacterium GW2011_GWB1_48_13]